MFRQTPLPRAGLIVAVGFAVLALAPPGWSQDRSTQERLDRLERDLNMLQRQVYRGGPPPMVNGDGGGAVNAQIRMDRIETGMRDLTGRVEEYVNQLEIVRQRVEQLQSDVEMRLGQGGAAIAAAPPPKPGFPSPPRPPRQFAAEQPGAADEEPPLRRSPGAPPTSLMPPGTAVPPPGGPIAGAPGPVFGTLTPPGVPASPTELASAVPAGQPPTAGTLSAGSATEQYNYAFGLLKQADYPAAEVALKAFIDQHPKDPMAGNAQYWLGETYFTRNRFIEAASAFAEGYKRWPKSAKAADNLLKLGMSLGRANQKDNACLAFRQLDHDFPNPGASIKSRAADEKKHLGC